MGMAASQARLLTITARLHDVEYKAQSIQNAKIQLSTQSDQVYNEYLEALNATSLTITDSNKNLIQANFNNLCGENAVQTGNQYALKDSNGRLIVSDDIDAAYHNYMEESGEVDPYMFAMWMLDTSSNPNEIKEKYSESESKAASETTYAFGKDSELKGILEKASSASGETFECVEDLENYLESNLEPSDTQYKTLKKYAENYRTTEQSYRYKLYQQNAEDIFTGGGSEAVDFDQSRFNYYVSIFNQIQTAGDCVSIADYNGPDGDAANDSDWLKNMIECGKITIDIVKTDSKTGEVSFNGTSPSSDSYLSYTTTTTMDKTALAKAEAEYEHKTKQINQKDKKFDNDLSKLETERTALTTEYDSVKKVISDNIERTFGIFS